MAKRKALPSKKKTRLSTAQVVFLVLTIVLVLSFVLSLVVNI
jgi:hypothetical protein